MHSLTRDALNSQEVGSKGSHARTHAIKGGMESGTRIHTIDCEYTRPQFAAAYLLNEAKEAAFIDNNTAHSVPLLLAELRRANLRPEQVRWVVITHVHLDHAGGTSALMKACPHATLLAHPRAAPHMIDPSKLVASARAVYGAAEFERLYGTIEAIPTERVRIMQDEEDVTLGDARLRFLHTRGHANHHMCVESLGTSEHVVFTGDSFGLRYPQLQRAGLFIFPSTSPTDFDAEEARKSIERIAGLSSSGAQAAYPTHYGRVEDLTAAREQLLSWIDFSERVLLEAVGSALSDDELAAHCTQRWRDEMLRVASARGLSLDAGDWELLHMDIELNGAGLAHVARKRRQKA